MRSILQYARRNWMKVALWIIFSLIIISAIKSCSPDKAQFGIGAGIWIFLFVGLIISAIISRERPYLAWTLTGFAGLIFLVMLGKIDVLFGWAILGLPIFAALGFYGSTKVEGGARTFLSLASSVVVLFWMHMFYQDGHQITGLGFFNETIPILFPDAIAKTIFIVFAGLLGFAVWKKSKILGIISALVLLSFFGNAIINPMIERFPDKLKPSPEAMKAIGNTATSAVKNIGDAVKSVTSSSSNPQSVSRELVGNFPVYLSGKSFNIREGKDGERQGTGEVFIPHLCETGYQYFFTLSGDFEKLFWHPPTKKISWQGNDSVAGQGVNKPFPNLQYGALTLRIGNKEGIFPSVANGEIGMMIVAPTPIFAEVNISREIGNYIDTTPVQQGEKLKNSTLSIKIERRRLIE